MCSLYTISDISFEHKEITVECKNQQEFDIFCENMRYYDGPTVSFRTLKDDFQLIKQLKWASNKKVFVTKIPKQMS